MNINILKKDRAFILGISEEFFKQKNIIEKLNDFNKIGVKGWELWLQVEYFLFLSNHPQVKKVDREKRCFLDGRKSKIKRSAILDFMIHEKRKTSAIPLEIKQDVSPTTCLRHMLNDVKKFEKIKYTGISTDRNLWCLGVHLGQLKEEYYEKCPYEITSIPIENTHYFYTLI
ncbi:hypothetical protein [Acinetobacter guerrae]|uniref:hypothetical protein n=1 Tax=Acinetobacter guerrae TaxID=1843371 RepID=UPI00125F139C|nr:hypothetical protein [Acinetobacter guerrae]